MDTTTIAKKPRNEKYFELLLDNERKDHRITKLSLKQLSDQYTTSTKVFNKIISELKEEIKVLKSNPDWVILNKSLANCKEMNEKHKSNHRLQIKDIETKAKSDRDKLNNQILHLQQEIEKLKKVNNG